MIEGKKEIKQSNSGLKNNNNCVTEKNPITNNNVSVFKNSESNKENIITLNKNYDNMSSQHILKPRLLNINHIDSNDKKNEMHGHCSYTTDFNEEVSKYIN